MKCSKCGFEHDGNFCPNCGAPSQTSQPPTNSQHPAPPLQQPTYIRPAPNAIAKPKKRLSTKQIVLIVVGVLVLGAIGGIAAFVTMDADIKTVQTHISAGEFAEAKVLLDKQISKNGTFEKVYNAYADFYMAQSDFLGAVEILGNGIKRCSSNDGLKKRIADINEKYADEIKEAKEKKEKEEKEAAEAAAKEEEERRKQEAQEQQKTQDEYIASCKSIDYSDLARNPDKYKGQPFKFTGEVIQVIEPTFGSTVVLRVNVTKTEFGFYTDTIYATVALPDGADRILQDDMITIYGDCDGLHSYTSVVGQKVSLPKLRIKYYAISK